MTNNSKGRERFQFPKGEFKDLTVDGLWYCVQCGKWHGIRHGHYSNHNCHEITFGKKPRMIIPKDAVIERTN
jgi:hypothetical protein